MNVYGSKKPCITKLPDSRFIPLIFYNHEMREMYTNTKREGIEHKCNIAELLTSIKRTYLSKILTNLCEIDNLPLVLVLGTNYRINLTRYL